MKWLLSIGAVLAAAGAARAQAEYEFILVEAFSLNYGLRECYLWDINDQGLACGTSTREYQVPNGTSITYSGLTWTAATEKVPLDAMTWPRGVNNAGLVVGGNLVFDLGAGAALATIPTPPGGYPGVSAADINDSGVVVGTVLTCNCSNSSGLNQFPWVWDAVSGVREVLVPGAKDLRRINSAGVAAGVIRYGAGMPDGYTYDTSTGAYTVLSSRLPQPPSGQTIWLMARDINAAGVVTGEYRQDDLFRDGFIWSEASGFTFFDGIGGASNVDVHPQGINDAGVVVGYAGYDPNLSGTHHAFVWDALRGTRDLNALAQGVPAGFILDRALEVNEQGWIIGDGHYGPNWGSSRAWVLRPLSPAPACYANCDDSTAAPVLNVADFTCFLGRFAAGCP